MGVLDSVQEKVGDIREDIDNKIEEILNSNPNISKDEVMQRLEDDYGIEVESYRDQIEAKIEEVKERVSNRE